MGVIFPERERQFFQRLAVFADLIERIHVRPVVARFVADQLQPAVSVQVRDRVERRIQAVFGQPDVLARGHESELVFHGSRFPHGFRSAPAFGRSAGAQGEQKRRCQENA